MLKLSVIIPTKNRASLLDRTLNSIVGQIFPNTDFEVIIIDNGSTDDTKKIVDIYKNKITNIKYFYDETPGLHIGRHRGLEGSQSEILVYADDDIEAFPTWLEAINESFNDDSVVLVGGKVLPKWEDDVPDWIDRLWNKKIKYGNCLTSLSILDFGDKILEIPPHFVFGCNFSIRKKILLETKGFHPDGMPKEKILFRGDGESFVSRYIELKKLKTVYNPKASIYHILTKERLTIDYFCNRAYNQGISDSFSILRSKYLKIKRKTNIYLKVIIFIKRFILTILYFLHIKKRDLHCEKIRNSYKSGYKTHQNSFKSDERLKEWVLRNNYL